MFQQFLPCTQSLELLGELSSIPDSKCRPSLLNEIRAKEASYNINKRTKSCKSKLLTLWQNSCLNVSFAAFKRPVFKTVTSQNCDLSQLEIFHIDVLGEPSHSQLIHNTNKNYTIIYTYSSKKFNNHNNQFSLF